MTTVIVLEVYHIKIFHQKEGVQNEKHFEVFEQREKVVRVVLDYGFGNYFVGTY